MYSDKCLYHCLVKLLDVVRLTNILTYLLTYLKFVFYVKVKCFVSTCSV